MYRAGRGVGYAFRAGLTVSILMVFLGAWQWPMTDFDIDTSFGEPAAETVSPGVELLSTSQEVVSAEEGEVIFSSGGARARGTIPYSLGSFVVLEHEGDFRSLYAHLDRRVELEGRAAEAGAKLGDVGATGLRGGNTLGFRIIDVERRAYVNPLSILPELEDDTAPRIEDVTLSRGGRRIWSNSPDSGDVSGEGDGVGAGRAELSARVYDRQDERLYRDGGTPHSVLVFMNGQEQFSVTLETLSLRDGEMRVGGRQSVEELYGPNGRIQLGSLEVTPGTNLLEIIATDDAGNERVLSLNITGESE